MDLSFIECVGVNFDLRRRPAPLGSSKKEVLNFYFLFFFYLGITLFDQKSLALLVPVADGGDRRQTTNKQKDIAAYRLNRPTGG